jgi:hypothetical protein
MREERPMSEAVIEALGLEARRSVRAARVPVPPRSRGVGDPGALAGARATTAL